MQGVLHYLCIFPYLFFLHKGFNTVLHVTGCHAPVCQKPGNSITQAMCNKLQPNLMALMYHAIVRESNCAYV